MALEIAVVPLNAHCHSVLFLKPAPLQQLLKTPLQRIVERTEEIFCKVQLHPPS